MCGIAEVLLTLRYKVSGTDLAESTATRRLRQLGRRYISGTPKRTSPERTPSWCRRR